MDSFFKKVLLACGGFVVFVLIIVAVIAGSLESDKRQSRKHSVATQKSASSQPAPLEKPKQKYVHKPVDPKKYGMIVISHEALPQSQEHADAFVEKIIKESGVLQEKKVLEELGDVKISSEEFSNREKTMDERIQHYQVKKDADPTDEESAERLQQLYLLKAMQNNLKGTVTGSTSQPSTPSPGDAATPPPQPSEGLP